ncbi:MAG TPA: hypothetical protein VKU01_23555 [Bryobacteraceae bacterium]|nr:hypothetical protein [Bryobacteraceae bacterium]
MNTPHATPFAPPAGFLPSFYRAGSGFSHPVPGPDDGCDDDPKKGHDAHDGHDTHDEDECEHKESHDKEHKD